MPDIAAVAAELAELDVVAVRSAALLKDQDELVLAAIERAHAGIVLDPDAEVLELARGLGTGNQQLVEMAPVHANEVQRSRGTEGGKVAAGLGKKGGVFRFVHLARGHRERRVVDRYREARMAGKNDVVRLVGEDRRAE